MKFLGAILLGVLAAVGVYLARHRIIFALKTGAIVYVVLIFGRLAVSVLTGGLQAEPLGEYVWPVFGLLIAWVVLSWFSTAYAQRRDREKQLRRASGAGRAVR
jgi:hypothetical protein